MTDFPLTDLTADAVVLCADLVRIDTSNPGRPERRAAEYVALRLGEVGIEGRILEMEAGRSNYLARLPGRVPAASPLLLHGHLDVAPADPGPWRHHPFSAELEMGCLWGRGTVDMKGIIAIVVAAVRRLMVTLVRPRRDIVLAFFADGTADGALGSGFLVREHPEVFGEATTALGGAGTFSVPHGARRLYPIRVAAATKPGLKAPRPDSAETTLVDDPLVRVMADALRIEDPVACPRPQLVPAATDANRLLPLGIACYDFAPLQRAADLDLTPLGHSGDERMPVEALAFGARVLYRLLVSY